MKNPAFCQRPKASYLMQTDNTQANSNPPAPQQPTLNTQRFRLTRFDRIVALVMLLIVAAIGLTMLLGDRVGVTLVRVGPLGTARSTSSITLQFSESMNRASVEPRLKLVQIPLQKINEVISDTDILATVAGISSWNGSIFNFRPTTALLPGGSYAVMFTAGASSESGRQVLSDYQYSFTVRSARLAYLAPATSTPFNLWISDPADPSSARQITTSPSGIYDYDISPDGSQIAFSEKNSNTGTMDIKLLDLESGVVEQLTNCADAECKTPVWRPDGQIIAYERIDLNSNLSQQVGASPTRIWLLDLSSKPATTRPMFSDSQILGYGLRWSADGSRVSMYDYGSQSILIYDFRTDTTELIPSRYGTPGELSPDGTKVIYPEIQLTESQAISYLQMANLTTKELARVSNPDDPVDEDTAIWSPDGSFLIVGRRYLDERATRGRQLYKVSPVDGSSEPLLVDARYQNGFFSLDPTGTQLVIQRFPDPVAMNDPNNMGIPEIWVLSLLDKSLTKVTDNAIFPRWVP
ncbi:MAG: Ig-like domain-containing protein [Anaerolineae bacterium]